MSMLRMLIKLFSRPKKGYVTPPFYPYKQSKLSKLKRKPKITGEWETK
jgi:hypothetical protein